MSYLVDEDYEYLGFDPDIINPASYNVRLKTIRRMTPEWLHFVKFPDTVKQMEYWNSLGRPDVKNKDHRHLFFAEEITFTPGYDLLLMPGEYALFSVDPPIALENGQMGLLFIRSGDARGGGNQFNTLIDPGFYGDLALEIMNHAPWPKYIRAMQQIAQIVTLIGPPSVRPYNGSYQGQVGAEPPR